MPKRKTSRPLPDGVKALLKADLNAPILEESSDVDDIDDENVDEDNDDTANLMSLEDALLDEVELIDFD